MGTVTFFRRGNPLLFLRLKLAPAKKGCCPHLWKYPLFVGAASAIALAMLSAAAAPPSQDALKATDDAGVVTVSSGGRAVMTYRYGGVAFKPYVQEFLSPSGVNVLRDNVPDHIHHHGLMFAVTADGTDFWSETANCGHETDRSVKTRSTVRDGAARAGLEETLDWVKPGGQEVVLTERRNIEAIRIDAAGPSLLTWQTRLETAPGREPVTLTGAHYFGLGMRFVQSMDATGQFMNSSGAPGDIVRGQERNVAAAWCAYAAEVDGKPVTAAIFSRPENARHPTTFFTMPVPFAYMSATLNLNKEPLKIDAGQPLVLRYGVAVWDGKASPEQIEAVYRQWLTLQKSSDF